MMPRQWIPLIVIILLSMTLVACNYPQIGDSEVSDSGEIGTITQVRTIVEQGVTEDQLQPVDTTNTINEGDILHVTDGGEGLLDFGDYLRLRLFNDTSVNTQSTVRTERAGDVSFFARIRLEAGGFTGELTKEGSSVVFDTPNGAQITVKGTQFWVVYDEENDELGVGNFNGTVDLAIDDSQVEISPAHYVLVPSGQAPEPEQPMDISLSDFDQAARGLGSPIAAMQTVVNQGTTAIANPTKATGISEGCKTGNVPAHIETDTTLSGDLFLTRDVIVRGKATLILTPGTHVTMCGEYKLHVQEGGLVAVGTEEQPIVIDADDPAVKWESIYIGNTFLENTILQHVVLNNGGGNDPDEIEGALHINEYYGTESPIPVVDHVIVNDSGSYGIVVETNSEDATPPQLSNLTINNSARAPIIMDASAVGGLGTGNRYFGNRPQTVQVGRFHSGLNGHGFLVYSQVWHDQGIPYEITGPVVMRDADRSGAPAVLAVESGVSFLMHPDVYFSIGTLYNGNTALNVNGTADQPVTFTPLNEETNEPWGSIIFGYEPGVAAESRLSHAILHYGGGANPEDFKGVLEKGGDGILKLDHVEIKYSTNTAVYSKNGSLEIADSILESNREGLRIRTSSAILRNNVIQNNALGGLINETPSDICIDALENYWGDMSGPADDSNALDACDLANTNSGLGDAVSDGVLYSPWLTNINR